MSELFNKVKEKWVLLLIILIAVIGVVVLAVFLLGNKEESYTIKFNGIDEVVSVEVSKGKYIEEPETPVKDGYTFLGWYSNGEEFDFNTEVSGDIELEAKWREDVDLTEEIYKVSYDSAGGTAIDTQEVNGNGMATEPVDPTKEDHEFLGWYYNDIEYNFTDLVTQDITLVAKWKEIISYTVTFDTDGGNKISSKKIVENTVVAKPTNPTKTGYEFTGWTLNGKTYNFSSKVTADITLTATWKKLEKYTVTFDSNGGSSVSSKTVYENAVVAKPTNPTRSGYTFTGWMLNGKTYNFSTKVTSNITLTAAWKEIKYYTVTFNSNGGSSVSTKTVVEDATVSKPTDPTRSGYTFTGWTLNGKTYNFSSKVTSNITLTATWKEIKYYTVTFNSNGGSNVSTKTVVENTAVAKPTNPTKSSHTFTGWTLNGTAYDFSSKVTSNITLVATWKEIKNYTVTFNSNGGSSVASKTVVENTAVTRPSNPTRTGYTFAGWTLNGSAYNFSSKVTSNITLVATWTQKNYTIRVTLVDQYSPDRYLTAYENGTAIAIKQLMYTDGVAIDASISGTTLTVSYADIVGETSFKIKLSDNTVVTATVN